MAFTVPKRGQSLKFRNSVTRLPSSAETDPSLRDWLPSRDKQKSIIREEIEKIEKQQEDYIKAAEAKEKEKLSLDQKIIELQENENKLKAEREEKMKKLKEEQAALEANRQKKIEQLMEEEKKLLAEREAKLKELQNQEKKLAADRENIKKNEQKLLAEKEDLKKKAAESVDVIHKKKEAIYAIGNGGIEELKRDLLLPENRQVALTAAFSGLALSGAAFGAFVTRRNWLPQDEDEDDMSFRNSTNFREGYNNGYQNDSGNLFRGERPVNGGLAGNTQYGNQRQPGYMNTAAPVSSRGAGPPLNNGSRGPQNVRGPQQNRGPAVAANGSRGPQNVRGPQQNRGTAVPMNNARGPVNGQGAVGASRGPAQTNQGTSRSDPYSASKARGPGPQQLNGSAQSSSARSPQTFSSSSSDPYGRDRSPSGQAVPMPVSNDAPSVAMPVLDTTANARGSTSRPESDPYGRQKDQRQPTQTSNDAPSVSIPMRGMMSQPPFSAPQSPSRRGNTNGRGQDESRRGSTVNPFMPSNGRDQSSRSMAGSRSDQGRMPMNNGSVRQTPPRRGPPGFMSSFVNGMNDAPSVSIPDAPMPPPKVSSPRLVSGNGRGSPTSTNNMSPRDAFRDRNQNTFQGGKGALSLTSGRSMPPDAKAGSPANIPDNLDRTGRERRQGFVGDRGALSLTSGRSMTPDIDLNRPASIPRYNDDPEGVTRTFTQNQGALSLTSGRSMSPDINPNRPANSPRYNDDPEGRRADFVQDGGALSLSSGRSMTPDVTPNDPVRPRNDDSGPG